MTSLSTMFYKSETVITLAAPNFLDPSTGEGF
jgi:hypothetical protein